MNKSHILTHIQRFAGRTRFVNREMVSTKGEENGKEIAVAGKKLEGNQPVQNEDNTSNGN